MSAVDKDTTHVLETLQDKGDYFSRLSAIERKRVNDLEDAIRHINHEIESLRTQQTISATEVLSLHVITPAPVKKKSDGANVSKEAQQSTTKILTIFESKLNRLLQKKSDVMNHIKKLKNQINHHRRLRVQTDMQHSKFEATLAETKANIERLLCESTAIVEERDKLLEKKATLEHLNIEEQNMFQEEYEKMGNFIKIQNQSLEEALLRERKRDLLDKKGQLDDSISKLKQGELTLDEELDMARQVGTLTNFVLSEQNSLSGIQSKINSYELIFEELKKMTGASSMEDVISTYVAQEEEMFSLYNFIQTVNSDIDMVLESTANIEQEINAYKEQQQIQNDQRMNIVKELESKHSQLLDHIVTTENEIRISQESVAQISKKVSSLFFKLQCDQMDIQKGNQGNSVNDGSLGNKSNKLSMSLGTRNQTNVTLLVCQGISESNVLDYMGCIEQRGVDIIAEYQHHKPNKQDLRVNAGPSAPFHWNAEPIIDLNEVEAEELITADYYYSTITSATSSSAAAAATAATGLAPSSVINIPGVGSINMDDMDSKVVDLSNYKKSLQKKLGLSNVKDMKDKIVTKPVKSNPKSPKASIKIKSNQ